MKIGPYDLEGELGRGGMGVVFRARSPRGEPVAVKLVLASDGEALARFDRERRLLEGLGAEAGFVPFLDAGRSPRGPYVVMPLVPGGTLRDRLRRGPLARDEAVALGVALARALGRAHALGVVHRDVKPENVLFDAAGRPLLADLGLAKAVRPGGVSGSLSRTGAFAGTVGYVPPEQVDDSKTVGPAADVFALGCVLFESLTGERPYPGDGLAGYTEALARGPRALGRALPGAPRWLEVVLARALAPRPEDRFPDGGAFARALEAGEGPRRRRPWGRLAAAGVAVAGILLAAAVVTLRARDRVRARALARQAVRASEDGEPARAARLVAEALALDGECAEAFAARADCRTLEGDGDGARRDAGEALAREPENALAHRVLGLLEFAAGRSDEALARADRAGVAAPDRPDAWQLRALVHREQGDLVRAIADLDEAIVRGPDRPRLRALRAECLIARRDWRRARADLDLLVTADPKNAFYRVWRAGVAEALGDVPAAERDHKEAVRLGTRDARPFEWLASRADFLASPEGADRALDYAERALERKSDSAQALAVRGTVRVLREHPGARDDLVRALELPDLPPRTAKKLRELLGTLDRRGPGPGR